jgi:hypothetical protein
MQNESFCKNTDSIFIPLNIETFRSRRDLNRNTVTVPKEIYGRHEQTEVYISALMRASGINRLQAKTCFYYTVSTHLLPDKLGLMPILAIIGPLGTGKSKLLTQLGRMVKQPKLIGAESQSTLRDELSNTVTALIDEGDKLYEPYLVRRYAKDTSQISYKLATDDKGWRKVDADIFGGTIIARRTPFADQATKSRSIVVATRYNPGDYYVTDIDREEIMKIADTASLALTSSQRVRDNWLPLQSIASSIDDREWLEFSEKQIEKDIQSMMASQDFEPDEAVLVALRENMLTSVGIQVIEMDVSISDLKGILKRHYDLNLKSYQIKEICSSLGFKVVTTGNYPKVKADKELLVRLLTEKVSKS